MVLRVLAALIPYLAPLHLLAAAEAAEAPHPKQVATVDLAVAAHKQPEDLEILQAPLRRKGVTVVRGRPLLLITVLVAAEARLRLALMEPVMRVVTVVPVQLQVFPVRL